VPIRLYEIPPLEAFLIIVILIETVSLIGLLLARRFVSPRIHFHDGVNDAISGTVQAIGVFYGITVGLIAVSVWTTNSNASDLVSREAAAIGGLYRDVRGYPPQLRDELRLELRDYTMQVIERDWPAQIRGQIDDGGVMILNDIQSRLFAFEPTTQGQAALHSETLHAFNTLAEYRRLRINAVSNGLSGVMWAVIWGGAVISIGVAYLFKIDDAKLHALLISLMAGFLAIVIFMIIVNDKPFYGYFNISTDPYKLILEKMPVTAS
jgi:Protein of unknown function (DUF4239)